MTLPRDFDRLYSADPDPWRVATSWYEQRRMEVLLSALRRPRYDLAWEPGCGTGELTVRLAQRCDRVIATDSSQEACALTRARADRATAEAGGAEGAGEILVERSGLPRRPAALCGGPGGNRDGEGAEAPGLIVLSEVLYYLDPADRRAVVDLLDELADEHTDIVAVHWRDRPERGSTDGLTVHTELDEALTRRRFGRLVSHTDDEFVLQLWSHDIPVLLGR